MISQPPIVLLDLHVNPNEASVSTIQETRHMNDYNSHVVCVRSDPFSLICSPADDENNSLRDGDL
jgi:hypothetical protein